MVKENSTVEPLETSAEAPAKKPKGELCWNCLNQDENNPLDSDGKCDVCGFEKKLLYNGNIEAEAASKRQAAAETDFNKGVLGK